VQVDVMAAFLTGFLATFVLLAVLPLWARERKGEDDWQNWEE
jgi:membrane-associated phospholipid phosphatase